MLSRSPFQALPSTVTKRIAHFVLNYGCSEDNSDPRKDTFWALYGTCQQWHHILFVYFYSQASLNFISNKKACLLFPRLPGRIRPRHDQNAYSQVKHVNLLLPTREGIFSDSILADLDTVLGSAVVFPKAHTLGIMANSRSGRDEAAVRRLDFPGIGKIAKCTEHSLPNISTLQLGYYTIRLADNPIFEDLGSGIYQLLSVALDDYDGYSFDQYLSKHLLGHPEFKLTSLYCDLHRCGSELLQLAYTHASLLTSLIMVFKYKNELCRLVQKDNGDIVTYPRLRYLYTASHNTESGIVVIDINDSVDPFPVLTQLTWKCHSYFNSDILFRGSCNTLEVLEMSFMNMFCAFNRYRAVEQGLFRSLRSIKAFGGLTGLSGSEFDNMEFLNILFRISSPVISNLELHLSSFGSRELVTAIGKHSTTLAIRRIYLQLTRFHLLDVVKVVKLLPTLEIFQFQMFEKPDSEELSVLDEFINKPDSCSHVLNDRLKHFEFFGGGDTSIEDVTVVLMMLVAGCSRLFNVVVGGSCRGSYYERINALLNNTPLRRYRERMSDVKLF